MNPWVSPKKFFFQKHNYLFTTATIILIQIKTALFHSLPYKYPLNIAPFLLLHTVSAHLNIPSRGYKLLSLSPEINRYCTVSFPYLLKSLAGDIIHHFSNAIISDSIIMNIAPFLWIQTDTAHLIPSLLIFLPKGACTGEGVIGIPPTPFQSQQKKQNNYHNLLNIVLNTANYHISSLNIPLPDFLLYWFS